MTTRDQINGVLNAPSQPDRMLSFQEISPEQSILVVVQGEIDDLVVEALRETVQRVAAFHGYKESQEKDGAQSR